MEGVYRLLASRFDDAGHRHERMVGRFMVHQGILLHLEDHSGALHELFPSGLITHRTQVRMDTIARSGHYRLLHEDDINQGVHPQHVQALDLGRTEPDSTFTLNGQGMPVPQIVEVWGDVVEVAGKRLSDDELHQIMSSVRDGTLILSPVE